MDPKLSALYLVWAFVLCIEAGTVSYNKLRQCTASETECGDECCTGNQWCNRNISGLAMCMTKCTGCSVGDRCCSFFDATSCCTSDKVCSLGKCRTLGSNGVHYQDDWSGYPITDSPDQGGVFPNTAKPPSTTEMPAFHRPEDVPFPDFDISNLDMKKDEFQDDSNQYINEDDFQDDFNTNNEDSSSSSSGSGHLAFVGVGGGGAGGFFVICFCVRRRRRVVVRRTIVTTGNRATTGNPATRGRPNAVNGTVPRGRPVVASGQAPAAAATTGYPGIAPSSHVSSGNQLSVVNEEGPPGPVAVGGQMDQPLGPPPPYSEYKVESDRERLCADA